MPKMHTNEADSGNLTPTDNSTSSSSEKSLRFLPLESSGTRGRLPRQGHTKSRTGCFNCKRRRIKCEENRPSCTQCSKRRLECQWPNIQIRKVLAKSNPPNTSIATPLQSQGAVFTMQDFRLFYHFIQHAFPRYPVNNEFIWTHDVPSISHNHDYLMHAMLALSASDLALRTVEGSQLYQSALSHRVKAIKSLNQALSNGLHTFEEGNAMLATCFSLIFQSVLLDDGLTEYMTFIRGTMLVAASMGCKSLNYLFKNLKWEEEISAMEPCLKDRPAIDPVLIDAAVRSLEAFSPLCQQDYEKVFHALLLKLARNMYISSREAFVTLMHVYTHFSNTMTQAQFTEFSNPQNNTRKLLQSHFVALQLLLQPATVQSDTVQPVVAQELKNLAGTEVTEPRTPGGESVRWLRNIHAGIDQEMRGVFDWPISMAQARGI